MDSKLLRVAIDGPSGSGKSTIAKLIAKDFGLDYVDTGAMYRAFGLKIIRSGIPCKQGPEMDALLEETSVDYRGGAVYLDGEDVSSLIRTQEVSKMASDCSAFKEVRSKLDSIQKEIGRTRSVVMDGRDICSVVMPHAEVKLYITASAEERARRRFLELQEKGENPVYETILKEINERDYNDTHRKVNPLIKVADAIEIDTTEMNIEEVLWEAKKCIIDTITSDPDQYDDFIEYTK